MTEMYNDGTYLENNPSWHEEDSAWKAKLIHQIIEKNSLNPNTICEIGCGAGRVIQQLASYYDGSKQFCGYDISPQAFALCEKRATANLIFKHFNLLDDESAHFDFLMAVDVFEHVEDVFGFLRKLKTKGDTILFHIPLDLSVQTVLRNDPIMNNRNSVGHIHFFTKDLALALLEDTGYDILDYAYTAGAVELPNQSWKRKLLRIPRKLMFAVHRDLAVRLFGGYSLLVLSK